MTPRRAALADALGLLAITLLLLDELRPGLLFLPTVMAGGDMPCHYPTFRFLYDHLLPQGRLHGWYAGGYLGHPLLLYYFPVPFLVMAALTPAVGPMVAFKLGVALGVFLLPLLVYAGFRAMGFRFPVPLLGAAAATVFLHMDEMGNAIWGGTIASTTTGEFSYTYGLGLAVLFLGHAYRRHHSARSPAPAALLLGLTAIAHGYAVLWAGLSTGFFLYGSRRPWRTLGWLVALGTLGFGVAAFFLVPLLGDWGWTTPYNDAWITVGWKNLLPPLLWPLFVLAVGGVAVAAGFRHHAREDLDRLLYLAHGALVGTCLALAGPALGIIDVRFVPFAQLALCLTGGAAAGLALQLLAGSDLAALGVVLCALAYADAGTHVVRPWIEWDFTGVEAKPLWPAFRRMNEAVAGSVADPRVAVEYDEQNGNAGSIRVYETVPFFSGRSTLEGVYNQASVITHPVYFLASELSPVSPNPFKSRDYSRFDLDGALAHLRLFQVDHVVSLSPTLTAALAARPGITQVAQAPPYHVFRLPDPGGYVEPLRFEPVATPLLGWRDKCFRWFSRKPQTRAHLVFSDDPRFLVREADPYLAPPEVPLPSAVHVQSTVGLESVDIETDTPGHPLLVKVSYHPRWRAEGADGPFLVSPGLMMVIPRQRHVRLFYARTAADTVGLGLTVAALAVIALWPRRRDDTVAGDGFRWGGLIPAAVMLALAGSRLLAHPGPDRKEAQTLVARAASAWTAGRWVEAAEYARNALPALDPSQRAATIVLRGEALLRAEQPRLAVEALEEVTRRDDEKAQLKPALLALVRAQEALGDHAAAGTYRDRLEKEFPSGN